MSNEIVFLGMEFPNIFVLLFFIMVIVFYVVYNIYPLCIHLYKSIKLINLPLVFLYIETSFKTTVPCLLIN